MTKGQVKHMFTFIIAILVVGAIALIGTRMVGNLMEDSCNAKTITFKTQLQAAISNNNGYGTLVEETFSNPCGQELLCLVDVDVIAEQSESSLVFVNASPQAIPDSARFIITQSIQDEVTQNIFLVQQDEIQAIGYAPQLTLNDTTDVLCISAQQGSFELIMHGKGRHTEVSPAR